MNRHSALQPLLSALALVMLAGCGGGSGSSPAPTPTPAGPHVLGINPTSGASVGGAAVTITGTGFTGVTGVQFGDTYAAYSFVSDTLINALAPGKAPGTSDVTVTTKHGTSPAVPADLYSYGAPPPPEVSGLETSSGPVGGFTSVTITGSGFTTGATVRFGTAAATGIVIVEDSNHISVSSPPGTGTVDVTVTDANGTSATSRADQFTYFVAPHATAISPSAGPNTGGTVVTVTGTGFTPGSLVLFGGVPASGVIVNSSTSLIATTPAVTGGAVGVTVVTANGTTSLSEAPVFTYPGPLLHPHITSISPTSGPDGTVVTITGTNFTSLYEVFIGVPSTYTVVSDTQIRATVPHEAGSQRRDVLLGNDAGFSDGLVYFTDTSP